MIAVTPTWEMQASSYYVYNYLSLLKVTIVLVPQVPSYITTLPIYDENGQLSQLIVGVMRYVVMAYY